MKKYGNIILDSDMPIDLPSSIQQTVHVVFTPVRTAGMTPEQLRRLTAFREKLATHLMEEQGLGGEVMVDELEEDGEPARLLTKEEAVKRKAWMERFKAGR